MHEKIKHYQDQIKLYAARLRDVRTIGVILFLTLLLLISWSGVKAIDTNYTLQKQIAGLQQQTSVQQLATNNLKLQNDYYKTPQYLELAARQDFGLAAKGETVLIVPHTVAMSHTVALAQDAPAAQKAKAKVPTYERNFQAWMDFFLHRPHADD